MALATTISIPPFPPIRIEIIVYNLAYPYNNDISKKTIKIQIAKPTKNGKEAAADEAQNYPR